MRSPINYANKSFFCSKDKKRERQRERERERERENSHIHIYNSMSIVSLSGKLIQLKSLLQFKSSEKRNRPFFALYLK